MAIDYGRGGAKKSQKGKSQYQPFQSTNVEQRLTAPELEEYQIALQTLSRPAQVSQRGAIQPAYLKQQQEAMDNANRLRSLAASRAFTDYTQSSMQYSKPWLAPKPTEGLITGQNVTYGLGNRPVLNSLSFAGEGTRAAPPPPSSAYMGQYQFQPISYADVASAKKRKKTSLIPQLGESQSVMPTQQNDLSNMVDLGNLSFGGY